ncbi:MAG TPA: hypothetical protein VK982_02895 [Bacteroidales bacterium]|nr:hypothetical protein [Bacteroidales bacterium]
MSDLKKRLLNHERNKHIVYDPEPHTYTYFPSGDKRKTTEAIKFNGITSWFGKYASPFDADAIAKSCNKNPNSEYYQMGEDAIKEQWNQQRIKGDNIHKVIEDSINLDGVYDEEYGFYIDQFWDVMFDNNLKPFVSEFVVYDEDIERATPIDVLATNEDGQVVPIDIKTYRKDLTYTGYNGKKMKHPLGGIYESKYSSVCLQISIERKWLLSKYGFKENELHDGYVAVLNDNGCKLIPTLDYINFVDLMYEYE